MFKFCVTNLTNTLPNLTSVYLTQPDITVPPWVLTRTFLEANKVQYQPLIAQAVP